jgi:phage shock protein PspC (stress-responsive transcriptional regulator)
MAATEPHPDNPERPDPPPRRLQRSRTDRVIGGVCGGLARHLRVDPILVRIAAVALLFAGGVSLVAYLAMLLFVPEEAADGAAGEQPARSGPSPGTIALVVVGGILAIPFLLGGAALLVPLAMVGGAGLLTWWLVSGEPLAGEARDVLRRSALGTAVLVGCALLFVGGFWAAGLGGGTVAAAAVIAGGVALVAGAFTHRLRWVALPATALALGVGLVSAAGISLDGGVGQRDYRPSSTSDIKDRYELGAGQLVVDLRATDLARGDTPLKLSVGMGQAFLVVPDDVCVVSRADVGAGQVDVFGRSDDGLDVRWSDHPRDRASGKRVVVDADVGFGELRVRHDRRELGGHGREARLTHGDSYTGAGNVGCGDA